MPTQSYLRRPDAVQAIWWDGTNTDEANELLKQANTGWQIGQDESGSFLVYGSEAEHYPVSNSWITTGGLIISDSDFQAQYVQGIAWVVAE